MIICTCSVYLYVTNTASRTWRLADGVLAAIPELNHVVEMPQVGSPGANGPGTPGLLDVGCMFPYIDVSGG